MLEMGVPDRSRGGLSGFMAAIQSLLSNPAILEVLAEAGGAAREGKPEQLKALAMGLIKSLLNQEMRIDKDGPEKHYGAPVLAALQSVGLNNAEGRARMQALVRSVGLSGLTPDTLLQAAHADLYRSHAREGRWEIKDPQLQDHQQWAGFASLWEHASPEGREQLSLQQALWKQVADYWEQVRGDQRVAGEAPGEPWGLTGQMHG